MQLALLHGNGNLGIVRILVADRSMIWPRKLRVQRSRTIVRRCTRHSPRLRSAAMRTRSKNLRIVLTASSKSLTKSMFPDTRIYRMRIWL